MKPDKEAHLMDGLRLCGVNDWFSFLIVLNTRLADIERDVYISPRNPRPLEYKTEAGSKKSRSSAFKNAQKKGALFEQLLAIWDQEDAETKANINHYLGADLKEQFKDSATSQSLFSELKEHFEPKIPGLRRQYEDELGFLSADLSIPIEEYIQSFSDTARDLLCTYDDLEEDVCKDREQSWMHALVRGLRIVSRFDTFVSKHYDRRKNEYQKISLLAQAIKDYCYWTSVDLDGPRINNKAGKRSFPTVASLK